MKHNERNKPKTKRIQLLQENNKRRIPIHRTRLSNICTKHNTKKGDTMKVKCDVCGFKCENDNHDEMTRHLWEEHTTKVQK